MPLEGGDTASTPNASAQRDKEYLVTITQPVATLDLLTRTQAARLLGIGLKTLDRLVKEGRLRHIKAGARILRFRLVDIELFLDESATNSTEKEDV